MTYNVFSETLNVIQPSPTNIIIVVSTTAGLAESNSSLPPGLWLIWLVSSVGWCSRDHNQLQALQSTYEYW